MNRATRYIELILLVVLTFMLLIFKYLVNLFRSIFPSFPDMFAIRLFREIGESRETGLDYPVKPDNDNHWNRVRYE